MLLGRTIAFLFTDTEGSTRHLSQLVEDYVKLVAGHYRLLIEEAVLIPIAYERARFLHRSRIKNYAISVYRYTWLENVISERH